MDIVTIFENVVHTAPESIAIFHDGFTVSYRELNLRANRLAHHLIGLGIKKGDFVGLYLDRSTEFIVGILAILKAGAGYVPIDTSYPDSRVQFMFDDSGIKLLISNAAYREKLKNSSFPILYLDTNKETSENRREANPDIALQENDVAYIMYTSGSTGTPKGVIIPHCGVVRLVVKPNYITILPSDNFLHVSNVSFDATTFEIWGPLLNCSRLTIISKNLLFTFSELKKCIHEHKISVIWVTTALFNQIASEVPDMFAGVRYVLLGGERVNPRFIKKILEHGRPENLINGYGPTENTTFSTTYRIENVEDETIPIPIGKSITNTTTIILDENLQRVATGISGELYVGGKGVALGYLHRPELTAEKFIINPLTNEPTDVLYRTGDIVRELPDGNIDFIGRTDNQVKVRGYRIELPEIETAIETHPAVREAVVILKENSLGDKDIAAFYLVHDKHSLSAKEVRDFLKQKLPAYMLPSYFTPMHSFPVTPNGKIDKNALGNIELHSSVSDTSDIDATTIEEEQMVKIWEEVLHYNPISIHDNFFELGGHSFLAFQVIAKIREAFFVDLPLRYIFESPTPAELTKRMIDFENDATGASTLLSLQTAGGKIPVYIVPPFNYIHHLYDFINKLGEDQPVYAFEPKYFSSDTYTVKSIQEIGSIYLGDMLKVNPDGPYIIGGWSLGGVIAFEMVRQLQAVHKNNFFLCFLDMEEMENDFNYYKLQPGLKLRCIKIWYAVDKFFFLMKVHKLQYVIKIYKSIKRRFFPDRNKAKIQEEKSQLPSAGFSAQLRKSQLEAFVQYAAKPLDCDVVNFVAIDRYRPPIERNTGCRAFVKGEYKEVFVSGNHNTFLKEPFISDVLAKFKEYLQNINNKSLASKQND